jgi:hypothetical protein
MAAPFAGSWWQHIRHAKLIELSRFQAIPIFISA